MKLSDNREALKTWFYALVFFLFIMLMISAAFVLVD